MNSLKEKNMMAAYEGFAGSQTVSHVLSFLPRELLEHLTGKQLGQVMTSINKAYHSGKNSLHGIDVADDAVWLPWGGGTYNPEKHLSGSHTPETGENGQLIPIAALREIKIHGNHYTLDFEEHL